MKEAVGFHVFMKEGHILSCLILNLIALCAKELVFWHFLRAADICI